jgi:hypothetical protein
VPDYCSSSPKMLAGLRQRYLLSNTSVGVWLATVAQPLDSFFQCP